MVRKRLSDFSASLQISHHTCFGPPCVIVSPRTEETDGEMKSDRRLRQRQADSGAGAMSRYWVELFCRLDSKTPFSITHNRIELHGDAARMGGAPVLDRPFDDYIGKTLPDAHGGPECVDDLTGWLAGRSDC